MTHNYLKSAFILCLFTVILGMSSCSLFDKELEQDRHIAFYRHQMLVSFDSLEHSKDRVLYLRRVLDSVKADKALITPRKKLELLKHCYSFISNEYTDIKQFDKALEYANIFIKSDSNDVRGYFIRGVAYQKMKNDSLALADYKKVYTMQPKHVSSYYNTALVYEDQVDYENALKYYTEAIKLKPSYLSSILANRANIHKAQGEYELALLDYNRAIELDTSNVLAYTNRGDVYSKRELYNKAIESYTKAINLDSEISDAYVRRAYSYELKKSYDSAKIDYSKVLLLDAKKVTKQKILAEDGLERLGKKAN